MLYQLWDDKKRDISSDTMSIQFWVLNSVTVYTSNQVRNESAENFLSLLKEWEKLCSYFSLVQNKVPHKQYVDLFSAEEDDDGGSGSGSEENNDEGGEEVFEVSELLAVRYCDPNRKSEKGLCFKVVTVRLFF